MRIRTRTKIKTGPGAGNLTLVRNVYEVELKRCREVYLGTVPGTATPAEIPIAVKLATGSDGAAVELTEFEIAQLKAYLKSNEPDPIAAVQALPGLIQSAARAIVERTKAMKVKGVDRGPELEKLVAAIRIAYEPGKSRNGFYEQMRRAKLITSRSRVKKVVQEKPAVTQPSQTQDRVPRDVSGPAGPI